MVRNSQGAQMRGSQGGQGRPGPQKGNLAWQANRTSKGPPQGPFNPVQEESSSETTSSSEDDDIVSSKMINIRNSEGPPTGSQSLASKFRRGSTNQRLAVNKDSEPELFRRLSHNRQGTEDLLQRLKQEKKRGNDSRATTASSGDGSSPRRSSSRGSGLGSIGLSRFVAPPKRPSSIAFPDSTRRPSSVPVPDFGSVSDTRRSSSVTDGAIRRPSGMMDPPFLPGPGARRSSAMQVMNQLGAPPAMGQPSVPRRPFAGKKKRSSEGEDDDVDLDESPKNRQNSLSTPVTPKARPSVLFGDKLSQLALSGGIDKVQRRPSTSLGTVTESQKSVQPAPSAMKGSHGPHSEDQQEPEKAKRGSVLASPKRGVGFAVDDEDEETGADSQTTRKVAFSAEEIPSEKSSSSRKAIPVAKSVAKKKKTSGPAGSEGEDRMIFRSLKDFIRYEAAQKAGRMMENVKYIQQTLEKTHDGNNDLLKEYQKLKRKEQRDVDKRDGVTPETMALFRDFDNKSKQKKKERTIKHQEMLRMDHRGSGKSAKQGKKSIFASEDRSLGFLMRKDTLQQIVSSFDGSDHTHLEAPQKPSGELPEKKLDSQEKRCTVKWQVEEKEDSQEKVVSTVITVPIFGDSDSDSSDEIWAPVKKKRLVAEVPRLRNRFRKQGLNQHVEQLMTVKRYREALVEFWGLAATWNQDQLYTVSEDELMHMATEKYHVDRERAARSIQLYFRSIRIRELLKDIDVEINNAVIVIQRWWKHQLLWKLPVRYAIKQAARAREAAVVLQAAWRRYRIFKMLLGLRTIVKIGNQMKILTGEVYAKDAGLRAVQKLQKWVRTIMVQKREEIRFKKVAEEKEKLVRESIHEQAPPSEEEQKKMRSRRTSWCAKGVGGFFRELGGKDRRASQAFGGGALGIPTKTSSQSIRFTRKQNAITDVDEEEEDLAIASGEQGSSGSGMNSAGSLQARKSIKEEDIQFSEESDEDLDEHRFPLDYDRVRMYGLPQMQGIEIRSKHVEIRRRR